MALAKETSVSRLLVDLSGNPGGFVDLAYLFVRAMHPRLQHHGRGVTGWGPAMGSEGSVELVTLKMSYLYRNYI